MNTTRPTYADVYGQADIDMVNDLNISGRLGRFVVLNNYSTDYNINDVIDAFPELDGYLPARGNTQTIRLDDLNSAINIYNNKLQRTRQTLRQNIRRHQRVAAEKKKNESNENFINKGFCI